jgi:site-specific DNA recombinase
MAVSQTSVPMNFEEAMALYRRQLGQRTRAAMAEKARSGGYSGFAPTGYRNVRAADGTSAVAIDPVLGPLVQEDFYLSGHAGSSIRKVLAELTPKGLVSRKGTRMNAASLQALLRNPFYVGTIRYQGQFYEGRHEPLVTLSCFARVQRRLRQRRCS